MLFRITSYWKKWGYLTLVGLAIATILVLALFRIGKKGSYTDLDTFKIPLSVIMKKSVKGRKTYRDFMSVLDSNRSVGNKRGAPRQSKGEVECRRVLEKYFSKPFPSVRPNFLMNPVTSDEGYGQNNLEIDCYNDSLKLGVEYNGVQHYKYVPYFHRNKEAFRNQKYRDYMKHEICKKNGVTLIDVPYTVKISNIENYLVEKLKALNFF